MGEELRWVGEIGEGNKEARHKIAIIHKLVTGMKVQHKVSSSVTSFHVDR